MIWPVSSLRSYERSPHEEKYDIAGRQCLSTHIVLDARLVSSCLSWPSRARPRLSLLSASVGLREKTLLSVNPGDTPILPVQSFYFLYRCVIIPFADYRIITYAPSVSTNGGHIFFLSFFFLTSSSIQLSR